MASTTTKDFIIIGAGIAGSVVASRLHERFPNLSILLIEAGPDVVNHPLVTDFSKGPFLVGSELDWTYTTLPQRHLDNQVRTNHGGKALGGSSAINAGGWIRGDKNDYDAWAKTVNDPIWSYAGLLPYFRKTEHYHDSKASPEEHGFEGPVYTQSVSSTAREYPLRDRVRKAYEAVGIVHKTDANSGSPQGIGELIENRNDGARQLTSSIYSLKGVEVLTETLAARVVVENVESQPTATGVELADGRVFKASKEVIISGGSYRTPQLLMLSGIGPKEVLSKHGISPVVDSPGVGQNLHDHLSVSLFWKLKEAAVQEGVSLGSPNMKMLPAFGKGTPMDWVCTYTVPHEGLKHALTLDGNQVDETHPQLAPPRSHIESFVVYAAGNPSAPAVAPDGSHVTSVTIGLLPTSRGTVTLASKDPAAAPIIDPNYYATEADRFVMREGLRKQLKALFETTEGQALIEAETVAEGQSPLTAKSSDAELDERVKERGKTVYHPAGTAAMGKVVDTKLRVNGVKGLRAVDASVIPQPIAGHYQAVTYALAEQAADIISSSHGHSV